MNRPYAPTVIAVFLPLSILAVDNCSSLTDCSREEPAPHERLVLGRPVDARLAFCTGNDVWQVDLQTGIYQVDVVAERSFWDLDIKLPSGLDINAHACAEFEADGGCTTRASAAAYRHRQVSFDNHQPGTAEVRISSGVFCEGPLPNFNCPFQDSTYGYTLRVDERDAGVFDASP
ncbi:MAG: hypothetical protein HY962_01225 [Ignavibacteriae bacterium]|nr:hypothetical protein [Ignavibacteriota bacterium]